MDSTATRATGLTYRDTPDLSTVYLDGKVVGHIRQLAYGMGWVYSPKGSAAKGEVMPTRAAVKLILEGAA